ncbi:MAG: AAA family ATPase [Blastocatellia bacterium]
MIKSIRFQNFKALRNATLPLGRFTLIVGPNGSGKSTVLKALELINDPSKLHFNQVVSADKRESGEITVEICMSPDNAFLTDDMILRWLTDQAGFQEYVGLYSAKWISAIKTTRVYSLNADSIAAPVALRPGIEMLKDGGNLAAVLDQLRDLHPERFESLNNALQQWLPEFDRILFETPKQGMRTFALRMRNGKHKIAATDLSQGTLLALAMLTLAYLPEPPALIGLEEPDRVMHPRLLRDVQDALYRLSYPENYGEEREPVQVIATTHSPYFLDLFRDHPEEVVIAEKIDQGTRFERLSDQPNIDEILQDSHLGEVWYTGILGGVPAHP